MLSSVQQRGLGIFLVAALSVTPAAAQANKGSKHLSQQRHTPYVSPRVKIAQQYGLTRRQASQLYDMRQGGRVVDADPKVVAIYRKELGRRTDPSAKARLANRLLDLASARRDLGPSDGFGKLVATERRLRQRGAGSRQSKAPQPVAAQPRTLGNRLRALFSSHRKRQPVTEPTVVPRPAGAPPRPRLRSVGPYDS